MIKLQYRFFSTFLLVSTAIWGQSSGYNQCCAKRRICAMKHTTTSLHVLCLPDFYLRFLAGIGIRELLKTGVAKDLVVLVFNHNHPVCGQLLVVVDFVLIYTVSVTTLGDKRYNAHCLITKLSASTGWTFIAAESCEYRFFPLCTT